MGSTPCVSRASAALPSGLPTYLAFLAIGQGLGLTDEVVGVSHAVLAGISLGAVCFGANTYVGNAPNFMISRHRHRSQGRDAELLRLHGL
jgi:Na+/H+ antiporter NhaD/arsenite permease-like protein